jgi:hypothetical protein
MVVGVSLICVKGWISLDQIPCMSCMSHMTQHDMTQPSHLIITSLFGQELVLRYLLSCSPSGWFL